MFFFLLTTSLPQRDFDEHSHCTRTLLTWTGKSIVGFVTSKKKKKKRKSRSLQNCSRIYLIALFLLYRHRPRSIVCHQKELSSFPSKTLLCSLHFEELNEPVSSNWTEWWMSYNFSLWLKCFVSFMCITSTEDMRHAFCLCESVYIYIYMYVGIGAVQDRASRALCCCIFLWQGFVLLSEKGNINVLVFCCCGGGLCWFFPLFFSLDF